VQWKRNDAFLPPPPHLYKGQDFGKEIIEEKLVLILYKTFFILGRIQRDTNYVGLRVN
jgi:hypothetical protein